MKAAGITVEKSDLEVFFKALNASEKTPEQLVKDGKSKLIVMPCGGGGGGGAGPAAAAEAPKEEKKEEEETVDMGGLFGDDDDGY
jgi:ribosomal protein L12E/L44/L45/RPP1/RPP2